MTASEGFREIHGGTRQAALHRSLTITGAGLTLGAGTVLARMTKEAPSQLAIDGEEERILALLSVAFGKAVPVQLIGNLKRASVQWARGDKCLAHIHLAHAGLPQLGEEGVARLTLAEEALAKRISPRALLKALGLDRPSRDALKFNPNQSRVPAGNGRESGRWTSGDGGSGASARIFPASEITHEGEHPEGDPKDDLYEERRALGAETTGEDIRHGRPIDPLQAPTVPLAGPPSKAVLIGNNSKPAGSRFNTDLPGGLEEATALFDSMTKGQAIEKDIGKDGATMLRAEDGTQLRINVDGSVRIDHPIAIDGKKQETIHFPGK